jgi:hypothetical protein
MAFAGAASLAIAHDSADKAALQVSGSNVQDKGEQSDRANADRAASSSVAAGKPNLIRATRSNRSSRSKSARRARSVRVVAQHQQLPRRTEATTSAV